MTDPSPVQTPTVPSTITPQPAGLIQRWDFGSETVQRLTSADFELDSKEGIALKHDSCTLVLFYIFNVESQDLAQIWASAASQVAGPVFAAVNMMSERRVAEAFTRVKMNGSHPLHWAGLRQYPFILVYREGWPVAVYNGPRTTQALMDYAITLACNAGYYEILQTGGGIEADSDMEMGNYKPYTNVAGQPPVVKRESVQFDANNPVRGFDRNLPVKPVQSPTAGSTSNLTEPQPVQGQGLGQSPGPTEAVATPSNVF